MLCSSFQITITVTVTTVQVSVFTQSLTSSSNRDSLFSITTLSPVEEIQKDTIQQKEKKKHLTKISVPDERTSSQAVGVAAVAILCAVGVFVVVADFMTLSRDFQMLKDNLSGICQSAEGNTGSLESDSKNTQMAEKGLKVDDRDILNQIPNTGYSQNESNRQYNNWSVINPCFSSNGEKSGNIDNQKFDNYAGPFGSGSTLTMYSSADNFGGDSTYSTPMRKMSRETIRDSIALTHPYLSRRKIIGLNAQRSLNETFQETSTIHPVVLKTDMSRDGFSHSHISVDDHEEGSSNCSSQEISQYADDDENTKRYKTDDIIYQKMGYLSQL